MYVVRIDFELVGKRDDEKAVDTIEDYLGMCLRNGQICSEEWSITFSENIYSVYVSTPERNSLSKKYHDTYMLDYLSKLAEKNLKRPRINIQGKVIDSEPTGKVESNSWFFLSTISMESPVYGGDDRKPIPLYQLPKTDFGNYYHILGWQSDYQSCCNLEFGSHTGERFAVRQFSKIDSSLSKRGIEVCNKLTELVGKPFYYDLFKLNGRSLKKERERVCPGCGSGDWLLDEPLYNWIDFKCDKCRLLSNIALQVRESLFK